MPQILAIEPDPRQAAVLKRVVRERVGATLVVAESKDTALAALKQHVPDLILVSALLSPRDEAELTDQLRKLDAAEHLQTLTIPQLASSGDEGSDRGSGLFGGKKRKKKNNSAPEGCDPTLFADEIVGYLTRARETREEMALRAQHEEKVRAAAAKQDEFASSEAPTPTSASGSTSSWESGFDSPAPRVAEPRPETTAPISTPTESGWESGTLPEIAAADQLVASTVEPQPDYAERLAEYDLPPQEQTPVEALESVAPEPVAPEPVASKVREISSIWKTPEQVAAVEAAAAARAAAAAAAPRLSISEIVESLVPKIRGYERPPLAENSPDESSAAIDVEKPAPEPVLQVESPAEVLASESQSVFDSPVFALPQPKEVAVAEVSLDELIETPKPQSAKARKKKPAIEDQDVVFELKSEESALSELEKEFGKLAIEVPKIQPPRKRSWMNLWKDRRTEAKAPPEPRVENAVAPSLPAVAPDPIAQPAPPVVSIEAAAKQVPFERRQFEEPDREVPAIAAEAPFTEPALLQRGGPESHQHVAPIGSPAPDAHSAPPPLDLATFRTPLEPAAETAAVPSPIASPPVVVPFAAPPQAPGIPAALEAAQAPPPPVEPPATVIAETTHWLAKAVDALRSEFQLLRKERALAPPPPPVSPFSLPIGVPIPPPVPESPSAPPRDTERLQSSGPDSPVYSKDDDRSPAPQPPKRAKKPKKPQTPRPVQDEWGMYDPNQAGIDALMARLEEQEQKQEQEENEEPVRSADRAVREEPAEPPSPPKAKSSAKVRDINSHPSRSNRAPEPAVRSTPRAAHLAAWARAESASASGALARSASNGGEEFRALLQGLHIPPEVAAIGYASGCRIRRVRITRHKRERAGSGPEPLIILSRRLLNNAREKRALESKEADPAPSV